MEYVLLLQRAWQIMRRHWVIWALGLIAVLAGQDALFNLRSGIRLQPFLEAVVNLPLSVANLLRADVPANTGVLLGLIMIVAGAMLILIGVTVQAAIIALTQSAERGDIVNFRIGLREGLRRMPVLFFIRLIFNIPSILISLVVFLGAARLVDSGSTPMGYNELLQALQAIGLLPILLILGAISGVLLGAIGIGADRSCVLDGTGVIESLRQGWHVLRENVFTYVVIGGILIATLVMIIFTISCPASLLLTDQLANTVPVVSGSADLVTFMIGTPVGLILLVILLVVYGGFTAFASIVWTLAYLRYA